MLILALDQSLKRSGWALIDDRRKVVQSGWFGVKGPNLRIKLDLFRDQVRQLVLDYEPELLVWEAPAIFRSQRANLSSARLDEALVGLSVGLDVRTCSVPASTWRAQLLGKGAGRMRSAEVKSRAMSYCRWLGLGDKDDNEAEAICIGLWCASVKGAEALA